jgi:streptogramin lyase
MIWQVLFLYMSRAFFLLNFSLALALVILLLGSTVATTAFAIPTDRKTLVIDSWDIGRFFKLASMGNTQSITVDFSGNIYLVEHSANKIARLSPDTNTVTEWTIPTASSGPTGIAFDALSNNVYFTEQNTNKIARLAPDTNTVTEWTIPTASSGPTGIAFDSSTGNLYFAENNTNKIGRFLPSSGAFTEWSINSKPSSALFMSSPGNAYFISGNRIINRLS